MWISTRLTRLFSSGEGHEITREEILALASLGHRDGNLISQENEYLNNILNLREIPTERVLTPRSVVHMLDQELTVTQALDLPQTQQFSRMPVFGKSIDDIVGKVIKRDLFSLERQGKGDEPLKNHVIPITRVAERLPVQQLIDLFIKERAHLFLVEDEFGQTAGIVTLEDAIETLLGREIVDESDTVEDMQELARGKYRARLRSDKLNQ